MIERSKDESEKLGKYQAMMMSGIIAAVIVFLAPTLIVVVTDTAVEPGQSAEDALFAPPKTCKAIPSGADVSSAPYSARGPCSEGQYHADTLPGNFSGQIQSLFGLLIWIVRIVIIMMIIVAVIMLYVENPESSSGQAVQAR